METREDPTAPVRLRWGWVGVAVLAIGAALWVSFWDQSWRSNQRLHLLETDAGRSALEVTANTLNGNLMGSVTLLGLLDPSIKQEATDGLLPEGATIVSTLAILGRAFHAEGVFVVGRDGKVRSSWDRVNKPSTGLDVRFRPYYQMAMDGKTGVYAAVSMARGDRSLYFSAPVYAEMAPSRYGVGAVVARTNLDKVDTLLKAYPEGALLLSPQGVVFASSRSDWVGRLAGEATPERLQNIRLLKQFGALFEERDPLALPVHNRSGLQQLDGSTFAVAQADVDWNDPGGTWSLLVMEDLSRTVPWSSTVWKGLLGGLTTALLGGMGLHLLRSRRTQALATQQLQQYADAQDLHAANRHALFMLSNALQRCNDLGSFANTFFQCARDIAAVAQGTLYSATDDDGHTLMLAGSCACATAPPETIKKGMGLTGQVIQERRSLLIPQPDNGLWTLRSGTGSTPMAALFIAPLIVQTRLVGVVEMAFFQGPSAQTQAILDELVSVLANHLELLRRTLHLEQQVAPPTDKAEASL